jgi:phosphonopyruvate decarboxylase
MITSKDLYDNLRNKGITFFTGVPDSLLKDFCAYITDNSSDENNIITANEGAAVALAAGHYLATGKIGLVYLQNSGFGNTINPLLSLVDPDVYNIPVLFLIGWRGEPGKKDEPQHVKQGKKTIQMLETLEIPYALIDSTITSSIEVVEAAYKNMNETKMPFAIVASDGTFETYTLQKKLKTNFAMNREQALQTIIDQLHDNDIVVSTTGKTSREVFEYRETLKQGHEKDFLTVGSMGHASQIALGIAIAKPSRQVFCLDGDGAALMHLGSLAICGCSNIKNFKHIVINNGAHDSVGGQPTVGFQISFSSVAHAVCYNKVLSVDTINDLNNAIQIVRNSDGPVFLEVKVNKGSRGDLGRPKTTPNENKIKFMEFVSK